MSIIPSQDQVMAQLRIIIPALGTIATAFGIGAAQAGSFTQIALASVGPISYVVVAIWSAFANTQKAKIMAVNAMPGVDSILVNAQASPILATIAMDNAVPKVAPMDSAKAAVSQIASAA